MTRHIISVSIISVVFFLPIYKFFLVVRLVSRAYLRWGGVVVLLHVGQLLLQQLVQLLQLLVPWCLVQPYWVLVLLLCWRVLGLLLAWGSNLLLRGEELQLLWGLELLLCWGAMLLLLAVLLLGWGASWVPGG